MALILELAWHHGSRQPSSATSTVTSAIIPSTDAADGDAICSSSNVTVGLAGSGPPAVGMVPWCVRGEAVVVVVVRDRRSRTGLLARDLREGDFERGTCSSLSKWPGNKMGLIPF